MIFFACCSEGLSGIINRFSGLNVAKYLGDGWEGGGGGGEVEKDGKFFNTRPSSSLTNLKNKVFEHIWAMDRVLSSKNDFFVLLTGTEYALGQVLFFY